MAFWGGFNPLLASAASLGGLNSYSYTGVGGVKLASTVLLLKKRTFIVAGGVKLASTATILKKKILTASGGIKTSGIGTTSKVTSHSYIVSGGVKLASTSTTLKKKIFTASGGIKTSGIAITNEYASYYVVSDIIDGNWLPSTGVDLYSCIDEIVSNTTDYIYTSSTSLCELALKPNLDPLVNTEHLIEYNIKGDGSTDLIVRLKQGAVTIASWTETNVPGVDTYYSHTLTNGEADSITNYSDLRIEFEAS